MSAAEKKEETKPKEEPKSLVTKLAEIMGLINRIAKNGRNDHHNYSYATEADIAEAVRGHMAERRIIMTPDVVDMQWADKAGSKMRIATLKVLFTVRDGETREEMKFHIYGQGEDAGDKATYKAMTGAEKYALLKLFLIPTGHDPEKDGENRYTPGQDGPTPAQRQDSSPPPADSPVVPFGKTKGKKLHEIDDADLQYHLTAAGKAAALNDPKWHAKNLAWLKACQDETARRLGLTSPAAASGTKSAPAAKSPRSSKLTPEAQAVWDKIKALCKAHNITEADATQRIKQLTGKTSRGELTEIDYGMLSGSLQAVPPKQTTPNGPVEPELF